MEHARQNPPHTCNMQGAGKKCSGELTKRKASIALARKCPRTFPNGTVWAVRLKNDAVGT
eukprot:12113787-Alexandrium_andersonii.AAC.1